MPLCVLVERPSLLGRQFDVCGCALDGHETLEWIVGYWLTNPPIQQAPDPTTCTVLVRG
jgi:hypothetical protein